MIMPLVKSGFRFHGFLSFSPQQPVQQVQQHFLVNASGE